MKFKHFLLTVFTIVLFSSLPVTTAFAQMDDDAFVEFFLFAETPEITSVTKTSQSVIQAPASITVITEKEIRNSGARNLSDILKYVPGVYVTNSRSGFDLVKIRGNQTRYNYRTLLIIDGIPRRDVFYGYMSISELVSVDNIKQVEVIRGPGSALYGTNAYSGVISITTKSGESLENIRVDAGAGEFSTQKLNVSLGHDFEEDVSLSLHARVLDSDGYDVDRGRDGHLTSETTDRNGHNVDFQLQLKDVTLLASQSLLEYSYPWERATRSKDREEENTVYAIKYFKNLTDTLGLNASVYHNNFKNLETTTRYEDDGSIDRWNESWTENSILGIDSHLLFEISDTNNLIVGVSAEKEETGKNEDITIREGREPSLDEWIQNDDGDMDFNFVNYALYMQYITQLSDFVELTLGVRYDDYEIFGDATNPRIAAVFSPIDKMKIKLIYGEAFRGPTYKELYIKEFDDDDVVIPAGRANTLLEPENIKTTEVELSYNINKNLVSRIRYFVNDEEDTIISVDDDTPYENLEGIESSGVEFEFSYIYEKVSGFLNYTYTDGEKSDGTELEGIPENLVNFVLEYKHTDNFHSRIGVRYVSDRNRPLDYHTGIDEDLENADALINEDNLGSYLDVELALVYTLNENWTVSGYIYNLLDDENYNPSYEPGEYWDILHSPRSYFVNVTYKMPK